MSHHDWEPDDWRELVAGVCVLIGLLFVCWWIGYSIWHSAHRPAPGPDVYQRAEIDCEKSGGTPNVQDVALGHYQDINGYLQTTTGTKVTCEAKP